MTTAPRHRSSASPLAAVMAALIVYASLYPFVGWRLPFVSPFAFLALPWPHWWTWFDLIANFFGYMPLGALLFGAGVRSGGRVGPVALWSIVTGAGLSLAMELLQNYLPQRVASNVDLGLNTLGNACGVGIGIAVHRLGGVERWQQVRDRWFIAQSRGALALLVLWPAGLLFPTPVPLGVGQVVERLRSAAADAADDTRFADWAAPWLEPAADPPPLSSMAEATAVLLGLLSPCLLAYSVSRPGWRRLLLVAGVAVCAAGASTLSTALNFGPDRALGWISAGVGPGFGGAALFAALLCWLPPRAAAGAALIALTGLVSLVAQAPADPYFAQSLHAWEQGRFIRFHGVAQWIGWLWPYAALAYLMMRVAASERPVEVPARNRKMGR